MVPDDRILQALERWSNARRDGIDIPIEQLCESSPEMQEELQQHIQILNAMSWLNSEPDQSDSSEMADVSAQQSPQQRRNDGSDGHSAWKPGDRILSDYLLVRPLGRGGMGEVWEALGPGGMPVALKRVFLKDRCSEAELAALQLFRQIRHPHLLAIHGYWTLDEALIIGLELADTSLAAAHSRAGSDRSGSLTITDILQYFTDAAEALDYLSRPVHRINNQIVRVQHRDVKPGNMLLQGGALKVADYGLAQALSGLIEPDSGSLTVAYAPPEFFQSRTAISSDQYSLGVSYCQLRTGRLPFQGSSAEIIDGHLRREPDLTGLTQQEQSVVKRAMDKDPFHRWHGCVKFVGELKRAVASLISDGISDDFSEALHAPTVLFRGRAVTTGQLFADSDLNELPRLQTHVKAVVAVCAASVRIRQSFINPGTRPLDATYVFPVPYQAAVHALEISVGSHCVVTGTLAEKSEARRSFDEASRSGDVATLADQTSPGILTVSLSNIPPGENVSVDLDYLQTLPFVENQYQLIIPLMTQSQSSSSTSLRADQLTIQVDLETGVPLCGYDSPSHDIELSEIDEARRVRIVMKGQETASDRDFVLTWRVAGPRLEHAVLWTPPKKSEPGTFLLTITPPRTSSGAAEKLAVIFLLHQSSTASGESCTLSLQLIEQLLDRLSFEDRFNIIVGDESLVPVDQDLLYADERPVRQGRTYLQKMSKSMHSAIRSPLHRAIGQLKKMSADGLVPVVVLVSSGVSESEPELFSLLRDERGSIRIVTALTGMSGNSVVLRKLATAGGGFTEFLVPGQNVSRTADRMLNRLRDAVLSDIQLEWPAESGISRTLPAPVPDVFRGQPVTVTGRFESGEFPLIRIRGKLAGLPWQHEVRPDEIRCLEATMPLTKLWAQYQIESLIDQMSDATPNRDQLKDQVVELALRHQLATPFTSFVATVSQQIMDDAKRTSGAMSVPPFVIEQLAAESPALAETVTSQKSAQPDSSRSAIELPENVVQPPRSGELPKENKRTLPETPARAGSWKSSDSAASSRGTGGIGRPSKPETPLGRSGKLGRVRTARVQMTVDLTEHGTTIRYELPHVIGVMAGFSGDAAERSDVSSRRFIACDRDNIDLILSQIRPRVNLHIPADPNGHGDAISVSLTFQSLRDFEASRVCLQLPHHHKISQQLLPVLSHPKFQALRSAWYGLNFLVSHSETSRALRICLLDLSQDECLQQFISSTSPETSLLYQRLAERDVTNSDTAPFSILIADYSFADSDRDLNLLQYLSATAAKALCPIVSAASVSLLRDEQLGQIGESADANAADSLKQNRSWLKLRDSDSSRFIGLALPPVAIPQSPVNPGDSGELRFLQSLPGEKGLPADSFLISAALVWATQFAHSTASTGWYSQLSATDGSLEIPSLPAPGSEAESLLQKSAQISDPQLPERIAAQHGLLCLSRSPVTGRLTFLSTPSLQRRTPGVLTRLRSVFKTLFRRISFGRNQESAGNSALTSGHLKSEADAVPLTWAIQSARFMQHLRILAHDRIRAESTPRQIQTDLQHWIQQYVTTRSASAESVDEGHRLLHFARVMVSANTASADTASADNVPSREVEISAWIAPVIPGEDRARMPKRETIRISL